MVWSSKNDLVLFDNKETYRIFRWSSFVIADDLFGDKPTIGVYKRLIATCLYSKKIEARYICQYIVNTND